VHQFLAVFQGKMEIWTLILLLLDSQFLHALFTVDNRDEIQKLKTGDQLSLTWVNSDDRSDSLKMG
jgi:hypothetical protein